MHRVLLPIDDNEARACGQAEFATELPGTADEVITVLTHTLTDDEADAPDELQNVDRVDTVRLVRELLEEYGIEVELAEARRPPAEGILEIASEFDVDHIVMGSHKRTPAGKVIFGSVSQQVLLESDIPVTVVGPRES